MVSSRVIERSTIYLDRIIQLDRTIEKEAIGLSACVSIHNTTAASEDRSVIRCLRLSLYRMPIDASSFVVWGGQLMECSTSMEVTRTERWHKEPWNGVSRVLRSML